MYRDLYIYIYKKYMVHLYIYIHIQTHMWSNIASVIDNYLVYKA